MFGKNMFVWVEVAAFSLISSQNGRILQPPILFNHHFHPEIRCFGLSGRLTRILDTLIELNTTKTQNVFFDDFY